MVGALGTPPETMRLSSLEFRVQRAFARSIAAPTDNEGNCVRCGRDENFQNAVYRQRENINW